MAQEKKNDLGIKVAYSEEEAFWLRVRDRADQEIKDSKRSILLNEEIKKIAEVKSKEAKKKA